jgi:hypothetical protein
LRTEAKELLVARLKAEQLMPKVIVFIVLVLILVRVCNHVDATLVRKAKPARPHMVHCGVGHAGIPQNSTPQTGQASTKQQ